jgi:hypothetical protein
MNKIRTDPEWEVEIKQRIEWVHAQTARGTTKRPAMMVKVKVTILIGCQ